MLNTFIALFSVCCALVIANNYAWTHRWGSLAGFLKPDRYPFESAGRHPRFRSSRPDDDIVSEAGAQAPNSNTQ